MKKIIYLLPVLFLASCSPAYGGVGFIIPVVSGLLAIYSAGRFLGLFGAKEHGSKFALICAIAMALLCIVFILYANAVK